MANDGGNVVPRITKAEHIGPDDTGDNINAKRVANYVWDGSNWARQTQSGGGGGGTEYTDGDASPTRPIGGIPVFDDGGVITAVSAAHPLPTTATITGGGDASAANQTTEITKLTSIDGKITAVNTGAVVVSSSALPSGAATAAKQPALGTAGTASADVITVQGKAAMTPILTDGSATTQPVSGTVTATGPLTDTQLRATAVPVSGTITANAGTNLNTSALATEAGNLASIKAKTDNIPAQGQALAAASLPVVLTAAQVTTLTPPAAITGFATSAKQDTGNTSLSSIDGKITAVNTGAVVVASSALPSGASTAAKQDEIITAIGAIPGGGGTQYTEDAAAAANPVGTALNLIREDARAGGLTSADGDNVAARGNNKGELYVKTTDSDALLTTIDADTGNIATSVASIDGKITAVNTGAVVVASGSITANAGTNLNTSTLATSTNITGGGQKSQIVDGSGNVIGATSNALNVHLDGGVTVLSGTFVDASDYDEDSAHVSGDKGSFVMGVRNDSLGTTFTTTDGDYSPIAVNNKGVVRIDPSGTTTQPVSLASTTVTGTVAVTQSGTWDEVGINDSGNSITVDNGGTFATQVDGAALTSLQLIDDTVFTDDTSTHSTGSTKVIGIGAVATPTDGSVNANDIGMPAMTTDRKLHVSVQDALPAGTNAIGKLAANSGVDIGDVDVTSVPTDPFGANADAASATGSISAKLRGIATALGITALDLGSGTGGSRTLRIFQDTAQFVGGTGTDTSATQRVSLATNVALPAGTNAIGKLAANSGVDIGDVDVTSVTFPTLVATSTYSPSSFKNLGANATLNVKSSAGNVFSVYCNNENAAERFIQLHNTATVPSSSDVPVYTFRVPPLGDVLIGTDFFTVAGTNFSTGIAFAFSTTKDTYTAGTAGEHSTLIMYK